MMLSVPKLKWFGGFGVKKLALKFNGSVQLKLSQHP